MKPSRHALSADQVQVERDYARGLAAIERFRLQAPALVALVRERGSTLDAAGAALLSELLNLSGVGAGEDVDRALLVELCKRQEAILRRFFELADGDVTREALHELAEMLGASLALTERVRAMVAETFAAFVKGIG